eukprot:CAMPEP_0197519134 /NCGR_PEP_ID=MMETSP1318-20131121/4397_1 /TAXON_ID=552666 /ORGANISM="Partenskyella glossopodia, Strain RCC365" /LENGTH=120 /DNA_ID=CAMNT_0043069941 /DNA_START=136 /DNA_END=498 /DNA_ORIENTATION=-
MIYDGRTRQFLKWLVSNEHSLSRQELLDLAMNATYRGNAAVLSSILDQRCLDTGLRLSDSFGSGGWNTNPLFVAIKAGQTDCVKVLLEKGTPIELGYHWSASKPIVDFMEQVATSEANIT